MTHIKKLYSACALAIALGTCSIAALAGEEVGNVIRVIGEANVKNDAGRKTALGNGDAVHVGDTVTTGVNASVQLQMKDGAIIALAGESEFNIKSYNYQPGNVLFVNDESAVNSSVNLKLEKGRLRTITGSTPKSAYSMNTPAAIVRIQGTVYDVLSKDSTTVILREGAVIVESLCNGAATGNTQLMDVPGMATEIAPCQPPKETEAEDVSDLDDIIPPPEPPDTCADNPALCPIDPCPMGPCFPPASP